MRVDNLVSIITPAYKAGRFIASAIESVQRQTHSNWEMIVVDDCSPDDTGSIVERYAQRDSRIHLIRQDTNKGPAVSRETALGYGKGRYVAFLDSDDLWLPSKLERQLRFMGQTDAAISFTGFRRISEDGGVCGKLIKIPESLSYSQLLKNTAIATSTVLVDRVKTGPFHMKQTYYDDFVLWLEILKRGFVAYGLQEDLMRYRVVGKSVSRDKRNSALWVWRTYRHVEKLSASRAVWCFVNYAWRGYRKYRVF